LKDWGNPDGEGELIQRVNPKEVNLMKWHLFVLLGIGFFPWSSSYGGPLTPAHFPSLVSSLKIGGPLEFCDERVPIEMQEVRERLEKELLLSLWDRPQVILWLKRSGRYLPHIEKVLKESGMPDDLKYLAIAESALRPHAGSRKGAIGFWQFTKFTGRKYGLVINERIDERRNILTSTLAAIRCFKHLREAFGSWTLAAAAYNMGEEGLMGEILEQESDNYYHLYLPLETQRFVFRILTVKLIFSDPERYGFQLSEEDYYPPMQFDRIQIDCFQDTPIAKDFQAQYQHLLKRWLAGRKERIYVIKKGDNLSSIADRFGVPLVAIIFWNRLDPNAPIHPGDELIIYRGEPKPDEIDKDEDDARAGSSWND
jgi:hypothetical protein